MAIGTEYSAAQDRLRNAGGAAAAYTGNSTSAANTVPDYVREVSITTDRTFTLTLPSGIIGQILEVNWTLSAAGVIVVKQGSTIIWVSPSFTVGTTGHMGFMYDGANWYAASGIMPVVNGIVAATGNIVANALVTLTAATVAYASASVPSVFGVAPAAAAATAACAVIPWGSQKIHTVDTTAAAVTANQLVAISGAVGEVVAWTTGSGAVIVGIAATTIGAGGGLIGVYPLRPYLSA